MFEKMLSGIGKSLK